MVGSGWRIAAIVFIVTVLKWESYNSQVVMKYGGITLVGLLVGWIMGDPITGLIVGGTMELMQVGLLGVVGSSVPDYQIGACVGVVLAIISGKGLDMALVVGVPAATLNVNFDILAKMAGECLMHTAQSLMGRGHYRSGFALIAFSSLSRAFFTGTLPTLMYLTLGSLFVSDLVDYAPQWLWSGMRLAGGILPALGICLLMRTLPNRALLGVMAGFILSAMLKLPMLAVAAIGVVAAVGAYRLAVSKSRCNESIRNAPAFDDCSECERKDAITGQLPRATLWRVFLRYLCVLQSAFNYETHISCGAVYAVEPALKRIYNGDEELHRHSLMSYFRFYNCQAYFSAPLLAASLAVEESMHSVEGVEVAGHMRASLMGPLTGVGDALFNTALKAVMASLCAHYALEGNPLGVVLCMTFGVFLLPVRWKMFLLGYRQGARWVVREHGTMQCLITALLVLESLILGSMIATNVTLPGVADALTGSVFIRQLAVWNLPGLVVFALMYVLLRSRTIQIPPQWMVWIIVIVCVSEQFVASLG